MEINEVQDPDYEVVTISNLGFVDPYGNEGLVILHSDDKKSGSNGGELDYWFGVTNKTNMYESFSDASFQMLNIGDISQVKNQEPKK